MSPVQPGGAQQPEASNEVAIRAWLDALAGGKCSESAFLQAMQERFRTDPESNWEVLSQLDQYFRRGRISAEVFKSVKTALAESALRVVAQAPASDSAAAPDIQPQPNASGALDADTRSIPIARDIVDSTQRRERSQSLDPIGEPKSGSILRRRYRLETLVGQGSNGPVFQAVDEYKLESPASQRLAIKIFHPAVVKRAELLADLQREFQVLQRLSHPNIVRVFEFDRDGSLVFFTMELLTGATLSRTLQARKLLPLSKDQAFAAIRDIGSALAYAHSQGVVHGDINPRNIFVTTQGDLRLLGFPGAFKGPHNPAALDPELSLPMTTSGYASCQILEGERPDARDDVFALACVAYLLLCGEHPLKQRTAIEARNSKATPKRPAQLSHRQWQILRAGLRWQREDRPADVQRWLAQLDLPSAATRFPPLRDLLELTPQKDPRTSWRAAAAATGVAVLAFAFWFISQRAVLPRTTFAPAQEPASALLPAQVAPPRAAASPPNSPPVTAPPVTAPPVTARTAAPAATPAAAPPSAAPSAAPLAAVSPLATAAAVPSHAAASPPATSPSVAPARSSKVELAADSVDIASGETSAQISVHRKGSLRGETSFTWWTESGTAKPGADFSAIVPQIAHIGDGKSSVTLSIPLSGATHPLPKSFYVVIDETDGGAALAGRTLMMVTLLPPD
jgi:serine/threonine protein kinase